MNKNQIKIDGILNAAAEMADKNGKIKLDVIRDMLMDGFAGAGNRHPKINDDGMVWCTYHNEYEPGENFATKLDKHGNIRYASMCRDGASTIRKIKRRRAKLMDDAIGWYRTKKFDAEKNAKKSRRID